MKRKSERQQETVRMKDNKESVRQQERVRVKDDRKGLE